MKALTLVVLFCGSMLFSSAITANPLNLSNFHKAITIGGPDAKKSYKVSDSRTRTCLNKRGCAPKKLRVKSKCPNNSY